MKATASLTPLRAACSDVAMSGRALSGKTGLLRKARPQYRDCPARAFALWLAMGRARGAMPGFTDKNRRSIMPSIKPKLR